MKIDESGNIVIPPVRVISNSRSYVSPLGAATAIMNSGNGLLDLWVPAEKPENGEYPIVRFVIDKRTLRPLFMKRTPLATYATSFIHVTQKGANDFLALEQRDRKTGFTRYEAFGLSPQGAVLGARWQLVPTLGDCEGCGTALSSDGRAYLYTDYIRGPARDHQQVFFQHLGPDFRPSGTGRPVSPPTRVNALDVSNVLSGGRRFVLYSEFDTSPSYSANNTRRTANPATNQRWLELHSQVYALYLQPVRAWTGERIGRRILLAPHTAPGQEQVAIIDPSGRFVVYLKLPNGLSGMVYQGLDVSGQPLGKPKLLTNIGGEELDILKD